MNQVSDDIKERLDIAEVIGEYIELKPAGTNLKACCPFHNEKTPSLMVSREKKIWHCFGCGEGGDVFSFVMKMEGVEFIDALRQLAKKAGVTLKKQSYSDTKVQNKSYEILELAVEFYHAILLRTKAGKKPLEYLTKRGLSINTIKNFKLGYSPTSWDALTSFLKRKNFSPGDLVKSGLVSSKEGTDRYFDRFRERIIFPISNIYGSYIGLGGRIMDPNSNMAKYINTPQSDIYDKSRVLYGIDKAKTSIRKLNYAVLVEGYTDVISSHQAGVQNVVSVSGTAFTKEQIDLIKRYSNNIILSFDVDTAGDNATTRAIDLALEAGMNIKIARVPGGKDPDECIRDNVANWKLALKQSQSILDYYFTKTLKGIDLNNVSDKKQAAATLIPVISKIPNKIEQTHYLQKLATLLNISEEILRDSVPKQTQQWIKPNNNPKKPEVNIPTHKTDLHFKETAHLIGLVLKKPAFLPQIINQDLSKIIHPTFHELYTELKMYYSKVEDEFSLSDFELNLEKFPKVAEKTAKLLLYIEKEYDFEELTTNDIEREINFHINYLNKRYFKNKLSSIKQKLQLAETEKNLPEIERLTAKVILLSGKYQKYLSK